MQAFSLSAQFAHESVMLKLPEERRRWGESKGARRGREREEKTYNIAGKHHILGLERKSLSYSVPEALWTKIKNLTALFSDKTSFN